MPFIITASGRHLDPWNCSHHDIDDRDVAIGLSNVCRWSAQLSAPFTVAEHSLAVARLLDRHFNDPILTLQGLLHDAPEAYIGDLATPLKHSAGMHAFRAMERHLLDAILDAAGVPTYLDPRVKSADRIVTLVEARDLCPWYEPILHPMPQYASYLDAAAAEPMRIVPIGDVLAVRTEFLGFFTLQRQRARQRDSALASQ